MTTCSCRCDTGLRPCHRIVRPGSFGRTPISFDDQVRRARFLADQGLALGVPDESDEAIQGAVRQLSEESVREGIRESLATVAEGEKLGGAHQTAEALTSLAAEFEPGPTSLTQRALRVRDEAKEGLKRRLGPSGTNRVRRLLGRPPIESAGRLRVVLNSEPPSPDIRRLTITSDPSIDDLLSDDVVEHVRSEASDSYLSARRLLIDRFYDVAVTD